MFYKTTLMGSPMTSYDAETDFKPIIINIIIDYNKISSCS